MGFADPDVFELLGPTGRDPGERRRLARVRGSGTSTAAVRPDDPRLLAAAAVRGRRQDDGLAGPCRATSRAPTLFALPIPMIDDQFVVAHGSRGRRRDRSAPGPPPRTSRVLELFAAQAGASLHNAQVHRGLEELKDRLDHEASHDALTELANRRRFTDELERISAAAVPAT